MRGGRLRVVAGTAGGRRLVAPPHARPTTERTREAIFDALGARVVDATVLDLYAGSGALAIEALSRGAARARLVEPDRRALDAIAANLAATGFADQARVDATTVARLLDAGAPPEAPFDLVLADPPYDAAAGELARVLARLADPGWLAADARVVLETARRDSPPAPGAGLEVRSSRRYGDTLVTTLGPAPGP